LSGTEPPGRKGRPGPAAPPPVGYGSLLTPQTAGAGGLLITAAALAALVTHCQAAPSGPAPAPTKPASSASAPASAPTFAPARQR
jgi:hypothetical protein